MVEDLIVKDRRHLSEDGIVLPIIAINKLTGKVETSPEIVTRGFSPGEDGFVDGARQIVMQTLESVERGGKSRLWCDQGKDSRRSEAICFQADAEAAADHAGDIGDLEVVILSGAQTSRREVCAGVEGPLPLSTLPGVGVLRLRSCFA